MVFIFAVDVVRSRLWYLFVTMSNNACASSNIGHCRVQCRGKSRKQPIRLLLTSPSHVTYPQLLPRSPEVRAWPEVKKETHCIHNKNHFVWINTIALSCLAYIRDMSDVLVTSHSWMEFTIPAKVPLLTQILCKPFFCKSSCFGCIGLSSYPISSAGIRRTWFSLVLL